MVAYGHQIHVPGEFPVNFDMALLEDNTQDRPWDMAISIMLTYQSLSHALLMRVEISNGVFKRFNKIWLPQSTFQHRALDGRMTSKNIINVSVDDAVRGRDNRRISSDIIRRASNDLNFARCRLFESPRTILAMLENIEVWGFVDVAVTFPFRYILDTAIAWSNEASIQATMRVHEYLQALYAKIIFLEERITIVSAIDISAD